MSANSRSPKPVKAVHLPPVDTTSPLARPVVPENAWQQLVASVGRGPILAVLFLAILLPALLCGALAVDVLRPNSETIPLQGAVDPNVALADGGHTVRVIALEAGTTNPIPFGTFRVDTWSGRYPERYEGELLSGAAVFIVGKEWIGQVDIRFNGTCTATGETFDFTATTELIGKPYGWDDRTVYFDSVC